MGGTDELLRNWNWNRLVMSCTEELLSCDVSGDVKCVYQDGGYRCRSGVLWSGRDIGHCTRPQTSDMVAFLLSAVCSGDGDDEEDEDDDVSAACLHFKSHPSADSRADLL